MDEEKSMSEEKLKLEDLLGGMHKSDEQERIDSVAVIGAGVMGQGIAESISSSGVDVILVEKSEERLKLAQDRLSDTMDREISRWTMTRSEKKAILSRIKWSMDLNDARDCALVIEAVEENLELKKEVFRQLDKIVPASAIIVSNTSTFNITEIAESTGRPEMIAGMCFQYPAPKVPLVELVKGYYTSEATLAKIKLFASRIGKTAIEVSEYPGFITTRAIVPLLNEAMHILMEGVSTAENIDTAIRLGYNFPVGPLEMADAMGLDEVLACMESLWKTLGESRYRPCPILRKLVRERKFGRKSGQGFYKYNEDGKII